MSAGSETSFRQCFCRAPDCRALFFICSYCDRGQVYCSDSCRQPARLEQRRQANRRYQQTLRGRVAHSRRQLAYRLRRARASYGLSKNIVTHHSSQTKLLVQPFRRVSSPSWVTTIFLRLLSAWAESGPVICQYCGRRGQFLKSS
jgi:hypothetical protein